MTLRPFVIPAIPPFFSSSFPSPPSFLIPDTCVWWGGTCLPGSGPQDTVLLFLLPVLFSFPAALLVFMSPLPLGSPSLCGTRSSLPGLSHRFECDTLQPPSGLTALLLPHLSWGTTKAKRTSFRKRTRFTPVASSFARREAEWAL